MGLIECTWFAGLFALAFGVGTWVGPAAGWAMLGVGLLATGALLAVSDRE